MNLQLTRNNDPRPTEKFDHPDITAKGEPRARVGLVKLETLWFNTGTLCNIECKNCYILSSPKNDSLVYLSTAEVVTFLDEIAEKKFGTREIAFTGGEPFLNPDMIEILDETLSRDFDVLVLTNAMQPMQRPRVSKGLLDLKERYGSRLVLRVSLDHHSQALHEEERGEKTWAKAIKGLDWLNDNGFAIAIAGRTCWGKDAAAERGGYRDLISRHGWAVDADDATRLVLLPEMEPAADVPEITTACWSILDKDPRSIMCASSRMVVKRKGAARPTVLPCTLIPYDARFDGGATLTEAFGADGGMYAKGAIKLCHVNCATFCVLGGGSCS